MEMSSFFNSIRTDGIGDRIYRAEDWAAYFASFIGNGVFPDPSDGLQVVSNIEGGMSVVIRTGKAWINGYFYRNEGDLILPLQNADGIMRRIDRIVIRWDLTARTITAKVKSSAYAANPITPALQRDADAFEICIGDVMIQPGATTVTQANIDDQRDKTDLCGWVIGVIEQIDPSSITAQFDAFFDEYVVLVATQMSEAQKTYDDFLTELEAFKQGSYDAVGEWFDPFKTEIENEVNAWFADYTSTLGEDEAVQLYNKIYNHEQAVIASDTGVHGMRYKDGILQILVADAWLTIATAVAGYSWAYIDTLNLTWEEWDVINYTWQEFESQIEKEAA